MLNLFSPIAIGYEPTIINVFETMSRFYATQSAAEQKKFDGYCSWLAKIKIINKFSLMAGFIGTIIGPLIFEDWITLIITDLLLCLQISGAQDSNREPSDQSIG